MNAEKVCNLIYSKKAKFINILGKHIFDKEEIEDHFQDCAMKLLSRNIPDENTESFLCTCFWNYGIDKARQKKNRPSKACIDDVPKYVVSDFQADCNIVDYENNREIELLISLLDKVKISDKERMAIEIFYLSEKTYEEAAKQVGCPVNSLKAWVHRGISILRQYIDDNDIKSSLFRRRATMYNSIIKQHTEGRINLTDDELDYVKNNWNKKTNMQILRYLNLRRARTLSLSALKYAAKGIVDSTKRQVRNPRELNEFERNYIIDKYKTVSDGIIANRLNSKANRSRTFNANAIYAIRKELGLERTEADKKAIVSMHARRAHRVSDSRDSLGRYIDQGKNSTEKKGTKVVYEFGHVSHISEPRAGRTIKRFRIKVNGKWKYLANYVWEMEFGKTPEGYKVRYKDHDPDEPTIDKVCVANMELISDRDIMKENALKRKPRIKKAVIMAAIAFCLFFQLRAGDTTKMVHLGPIIMKEFFTVTPDQRTITIDDANRVDHYWQYQFTWGDGDTSRVKTFAKPGFYNVQIKKEMRWPYYYGGSGNPQFYNQRDGYTYSCVTPYEVQRATYNVVITKPSIFKKLKLTLYKLLK